MRTFRVSVPAVLLMAAMACASSSAVAADAVAHLGSRVAAKSAVWTRSYFGRGRTIAMSATNGLWSGMEMTRRIS